MDKYEKSIITEEGHRLFKEFKESWKDYGGYIDKVLELDKAGEDSEAAVLMNGDAKPHKAYSSKRSFEENYVHYRDLLATMDRVQDICEKRFLFRKLFGMLNQMELGIRSQGKETT
jgi:hypothetical protein